MPTYQYRCPACGHQFSKFQKMSAKTRVKCPTCGTSAERVITGGAGLLFKGSGFYITDYKKSGEAKGEKGEKAEKAEKASDASKAPKGDVKKAAEKPSQKSGDDH